MGSRVVVHNVIHTLIRATTKQLTASMEKRMTIAGIPFPIPQGWEENAFPVKACFSKDGHMCIQVERY